MKTDRSPVPVLRVLERTSDTWQDRPGGTLPKEEMGSTDKGDQGSAYWIIVENTDEVVRAAQEHSVAVDELQTRLSQVSITSARIAPRVIRIDESALFVTVPTASYDDEQVTTGKLVMLVTPTMIFTAEEGTGGITGRVVVRLAEHRALRGSGPLPVLGTMLVELVAEASDVELALGDAVANVEVVVFRLNDDPLSRLYNLKREIAEARRALVPLSAELPDLGDDHTTKVVEPLRLERALLERLITHAERIDRHLDSHDSLLSDMLTVRLSLVSVRQNEDMRKISAWAAMAAVPTLIAGVYGMNFRHMPELSWTWGYPAVIAAMGLLCFGLYRAFKRNGWL
jgi:magnesium transporter